MNPNGGIPSTPPARLSRRRAIRGLARGIILLVAVLVGLAAAVRRPVAPPAPDAPEVGGELPGPLPLFPPDNWWNLDIADAPPDPGSDAFMGVIGPKARLHPDFGGPKVGVAKYGVPYVVVGGDQPKRAVAFRYQNESDGVDRTTKQSLPFYPIPDEAITQPGFIEGGQPGNAADVRGDRHMLIVDRDRKHLYELFGLGYRDGQWRAGSGAFFDMNRNDRRPEGWTSADAAGLAILPGLVRYDEVYGPGEIAHAFRVTVRGTNGSVFPASHHAGRKVGALPMGARLRLKARTDLSAYPPPLQKIFRAMKRYGLIVADNGSNLYVQGALHPRWDNSVLNPAFHSLGAADFEVVQLGYRPSPVAGTAREP
jgi:hypothetical protein